MRFAVIIEQGESSYGAYVHDLPGCPAKVLILFPVLDSPIA